MTKPTHQRTGDTTARHRKKQRIHFITYIETYTRMITLSGLSDPTTGTMEFCDVTAPYFTIFPLHTGGLLMQIRIVMAETNLFECVN